MSGKRLWLFSAALLGIYLIAGADIGHRLRVDPDRFTECARPAPAADQADLLRVRDIRLSIADPDWDFFFTRPPLSLSAFQEARMEYPGRLTPLKVSMRIRGGHAWHWRPEKPSLRVRLPFGRTLEGRRILDLINPEDPAMVTNLLSDFLAARAGVAASVTRWARVWLNDRFLGMYHLTDRIDGTLLANLGLPELPVAEGNRRTSDLWMDPDLWEVHGGAMTVRDQCRPIFTKLLNLTRPPLDVARVASLGAYLDLARTASWSAVVTAVGSLQADDVHNQHWAFDNTASVRFWPVFADSGGFGAVTRYGLVTRPEDIELWPYEFLFPFLDAAFRNPYFVARRNMTLWRLLQGEAHPARIASLAADLHSLVAPEIVRENHRGALITIPGLGVPVRVPISAATIASEVAQIGRWMDHRATYLGEILASLTVTVYPPEAASGAWLLLPITVWGHAPAEWDLGELASAVRLDRNRDGRVDADDAPCSSRLRLYPAMQEESAAGREWLRGDRRLLSHLLVPASQTYLLGIAADRAVGLLAKFRNDAVNAVTGAAVPVEIGTTSSMPSLYSHTASLHPWALAPGTLDW